MALTLPTIRAALQAKSPITGGGFTLSLARTVLGYIHLASNNTLLADLASSGPYMVIHEGALLGPLNTEVAGGGGSRYTLTAELYIGVTRSSDYDFSNSGALVKAIVDAWYTYAAVETVTVDEPDVSTDRNPVVIKYTFTAEAIGC